MSLNSMLDVSVETQLQICDMSDMSRDGIGKLGFNFKF